MRATTPSQKKNKENQKYPSAGCIVCTQQHRQTKAAKKGFGEKKVLTKQPEVVFSAQLEALTGDELPVREGSICRFSKFHKGNQQRSKAMGAIRVFPWKELGCGHIFWKIRAARLQRRASL